jgi:hypothetical protein
MYSMRLRWSKTAFEALLRELTDPSRAQMTAGV